MKHILLAIAILLSFPSAARACPQLLGLDDSGFGAGGRRNWQQAGNRFYRHHDYQAIDGIQLDSDQRADFNAAYDEVVLSSGAGGVELFWRLTISPDATNTTLTISGLANPDREGILNNRATEYLQLGNGTANIDPGSTVIVRAVANGGAVGPITVTATGICP